MKNKAFYSAETQHGCRVIKVCCERMTMWYNVSAFLSNDAGLIPHRSRTAAFLYTELELSLKKSTVQTLHITLQVRNIVDKQSKNAII